MSANSMVLYLGINISEFIITKFQMVQDNEALLSMWHDEKYFMKIIVFLKQLELVLLNIK